MFLSGHLSFSENKKLMNFHYVLITRNNRMDMNDTSYEADVVFKSKIVYHFCRPTVKYQNIRHYFACDVSNKLPVIVLDSCKRVVVCD